MNSFWSLNLYNNSVRKFLFKLYNNTQGYNHAVAHFVGNHSPNCTFCDIIGDQDIVNETPLHLFFTCRSIEGFLESIFKWLTNDDNFEFTRTEFFTFTKGQILQSQKIYVLVESLQSHFILTMCHWFSGLPVCFPSQGTWVQITRGALI
jgi:hypothetical protein